MTGLPVGVVPFEVHLEVWTLVAGAIALGWYALRVLEPKAVAAGYEPISRRQKFTYGLALASMWIFSDWPIHEIAEGYLYFVHMLQHLFLSMLIPALFLLSTPRWLFEIMLPSTSKARQVVRKLSRPIVAGLTFNALTLLLHWPNLVQLSFDSAAVHFLLHLVVFASGLLMWMPVIGPERSWRLSPFAQCFYLFSMSIVPTVPGGWLVFAEDVVYRHYDTADRLFSIDVLTDQQAAGVVMKLVGGFFLWAVIFFIFIRWAQSEMQTDEHNRLARQSRDRADRENGDSIKVGATSDNAELIDVTEGHEGQRRANDRLEAELTFEQVAEEFARTEPRIERK